MPGGTGEIGGGSCNVSFRCPGVRPAWRPHGGNPNPVGAAGDAAELEDTAQACPFDVLVTFPDKTARIVTVDRGKKITFHWPWPPAASTAKRKPKAKGKRRRSK